jgi:3-methyladenine DNA glycosylase/8-oxoguanine DNA glycosylase
VATVESHGWRRLAPFRWSPEERVLRRNDMAITHDGKALHVEGNADRKQLARMFQLDIDITEFIALTRDSQPHAWVERQGFGRLLCAPTLFEDVVKVILTTNVQWSQTVKMAELLVAVCGRNGGFPTPKDIARFTPDELKERCRLGYRATSIHRLAAGILAGSLDLDAISDPGQSTEELFASYLALPGIGPYGAAHLLAMDGRHDFIAVDTEFRRFVRQTYHGGRAVSDKTMLRRYAKWGRWKYLAYWAELHGER